MSMNETTTLTAQGHPTKAAVQGVIDRLKRAVPASTVEMGLPYVFREVEGACGTVACHAGHYAAVSLMHPEGDDGARPYWDGERWGPGRRYPGDREILREGVPALMRVPISFHRGALLLAQHLGFAHSMDLEEWAGAHPDVWGNRFGAQLFSAGAYAFAVDDEEANGETPMPAVFPIERVIRKWEQVRDNLPEEPDGAGARDAVCRMAMHFDAAGLFPDPIR